MYNNIGVSVIPVLHTLRSYVDIKGSTYNHWEVCFKEKIQRRVLQGQQAIKMMVSRLLFMLVGYLLIVSQTCFLLFEDNLYN